MAGAAGCLVGIVHRTEKPVQSVDGAPGHHDAQHQRSRRCGHEFIPTGSIHLRPQPTHTPQAGEFKVIRWLVGIAIIAIDCIWWACESARA
jgi:hypothetical protein